MRVAEATRRVEARVAVVVNVPCVVKVARGASTQEGEEGVRRRDPCRVPEEVRDVRLEVV